MADDDDEGGGAGFPSVDEIEYYNLDVERDMETETGGSETSAKFRPGDHVWMWCTAIGGIRYQHHGIVVGADDADDPSMLRIADFTAPDHSNFALPVSIASCASASATATGDGAGRLPSWHGVRITSYNNVAEWHKENYPGTINNHDDGDSRSKDDHPENNEGGDPQLVLRRVQFLLQNPHLLPAYELLESNCEAVAVWCKTGTFRTRQVSNVMHGGKRNSAVVAGTAAVATGIVGALALPVAAGAGVAWSLLSMKQWESEKKCEERTKTLNEGFEKWLADGGNGGGGVGGSGQCTVL